MADDNYRPRRPARRRPRRRRGIHPALMVLLALFLLGGLGLLGYGVVRLVQGGSDRSRSDQSSEDKHGSSEEVGKELDEVIAETDQQDPHWRLEDITARRSPVAEGNNGALEVQRIRQLLPNPWPPSTLFRPASLAPNRLPNAVTLQAVKGELARYIHAVAGGRNLGKYATGRYSFSWGRNFVDTNINHLVQPRAVGALMELDALVLAHDGDADGALASARAVLAAGRSIGDEPFTLSQTVRVAVGMIGIGTVERCVALGQPSEAALLATQRLIEDEAAQPLLWRTLRAERGGLHAILTAVAQGKIDRAALERERPEPNSLTGGLLALVRDERLTRPASLQKGHVWLLRQMNLAVMAAQAPPHEQRQALKKLADQAGQAPESVRAVYPHLPRIADAFHRHQAMLRTARVGLALERYRLRYERWPARLEDLKDAFLTDLPADPFDGQPLRYRTDAQGAVVYSVGLDGQDHGGPFASLNTHQPGTDLGFRLWEPRLRRQP